MFSAYFPPVSPRLLPKQKGAAHAPRGVHQAAGLLVARALVVLAPQRVLDVISPSIRLVGLERVDVTQDRPQCHHALSGGLVNRLELPKNRLELPKSRYRIDVSRLTQTSVCLIGLLAPPLAARPRDLVATSPLPRRLAGTSPAP